MSASGAPDQVQTHARRGTPPALQLWWAYPPGLADPGIEQACSSILNDGERAHAARFHFERNRFEYLCSHTLARIALSHAHPLPPQSWSYSFNKYGKPSPIPECGLRFNQSDSVGLVVCLVAQGVEVGVDVEERSRAPQIVGLASDVFSPAEQAQLHALPEAARPDRALALWTLKEAYIKARGMGLALPLAKISFLFDSSNQIHLDLDPTLGDDPARWHFCFIDHADHRIALVVEAPIPPALKIFDADPLFAAPRRLPSASQIWFPPRVRQGSSHSAG
jgi:4'-phosphopantetheinyl transferase